jgi:2-polyprenyl-3-methyl-5-hydroxy-6-metoxy-1,4-benzoquinol methylase
MPPLPSRPGGDQLTLVERELFDQYTAVLQAPVLVIGHKLGFFAELEEPLDGATLAARTGVAPRLTQEWLRAAAAGKLLNFRQDEGTFQLPMNIRSALHGENGTYHAARAELALLVTTRLPQILAAFEGEDISPFSDHAKFTALASEVNKIRYRRHLIADYIGVAKGVVERLETGANVAEFGCGEGSNLAILARAFPASRFVGFDPGSSVELDTIGRRANVTFLKAPLEEAQREAFDCILALEALHEVADPCATLAAVRPLLKRDGVFVLVEVSAGKFGENLDSALAPALYGMSLLHCVPAAGAAPMTPGMLWAAEDVIFALRGAGFDSIRSFQVPAEAPIHTVYTAETKFR